MKYWRIVVGAILVALLAVGGWGMVRVADMPKTYTITDDFKKHVDKADTKFEAVQRTIIEQGQRMEDKLDDIQEYLMK